MKKFLIPALVVLLAVNSGYGQNRTWGTLQIPVAENWTIKHKDQTVELSNYNLGGGEPFTITLFPAEPFTGKPDTLFAHAWKQWVTHAPLAKEIPKWRRYYTEEGVLIQQGFIEFTGAEGPLYRQLNVFVLDGSYQACLFETTTAKNYRLVQYEWQDRITGVKKLAAKNR